MVKVMPYGTYRAILHGLFYDETGEARLSDLPVHVMRAWEGSGLRTVDMTADESLASMHGQPLSAIE